MSAPAWIVDAVAAGNAPEPTSLARVAIAPAPSTRDTAAETPDGLVMTPTAARIVEGLQLAQMLADVAVIYGAPGVGKSTAAQHYARTGCAVWYVVAHPGNAGVVPLLEDVCAALAIPRQNGAAELHRAIVYYAERADATGLLDARPGLLIVDEAQHASADALEALRSIHDAAGVGLALIGNRDLYARIMGGKEAAKLDGLRARIGRRVHLEGSSEGDAAALADVWGVSAAGGRKVLAEACAAEGGLRHAVKVLRLASLRARAAGRKRTDADLRAAWSEIGGA